jgi:hypothetical protein
MDEVKHGADGDEGNGCGDREVEPGKVVERQRQDIVDGQRRQAGREIAGAGLSRSRFTASLSIAKVTRSSLLAADRGTVGEKP